MRKKGNLLIMLIEISQTEKDKCCMILLICGILKKKENQELVVGEVEGDRNEGLLARGTKISGHGGSI